MTELRIKSAADAAMDRLLRVTPSQWTGAGWVVLAVWTAVWLTHRVPDERPDLAAEQERFVAQRNALIGPREIDALSSCARTALVGDGSNRPWTRAEAWRQEQLCRDANLLQQHQRYAARM